MRRHMYRPADPLSTMERGGTGPHQAEDRVSTALRRVNGGIALERKPLTQLLLERVPSTTCHDRSEYRFDLFVLRDFAASLPASLHWRLLLPVLFFVDLDDGDRCFIISADTFTALRVLGLLHGRRELVGNRLYLDRSVAEGFIARFPGMGQVAVAPLLA